VTEAENDRPRATVTPGLLVAEGRLRLDTCANAGSQRQMFPQAMAHGMTKLRIREVSISVVRSGHCRPKFTRNSHTTNSRRGCTPTRTTGARVVDMLFRGRSLGIQIVLYRTTTRSTPSVIKDLRFPSQEKFLTPRNDRLINCVGFSRRAYATLVPSMPAGARRTARRATLPGSLAKNPKKFGGAGAAGDGSRAIACWRQKPPGGGPSGGC